MAAVEFRSYFMFAVLCLNNSDRVKYTLEVKMGQVNQIIKIRRRPRRQVQSGEWGQEGRIYKIKQEVKKTPNHDKDFMLNTYFEIFLVQNIQRTAGHIAFIKMTSKMYEQNVPTHEIMAFEATFLQHYPPVLSEDFKTPL